MRHDVESITKDFNVKGCGGINQKLHKIRRKDGQGVCTNIFGCIKVKEMRKITLKIHFLTRINISTARFKKKLIILVRVEDELREYLM